MFQHKKYIMRKKFKNINLLLVFVLSFVFSFGQDSTALEKEKLFTLIDYIQNYYVEDVNQHTLVEKAIKNILKDLDPHSVYISKEAVEKTNEPLKGNFEGVGIQFNILQDTILVVATISGGPSEKVGLMAGDKIIKIDQEDVAGIKIDNAGVAKRLRGDKGTEVTVGIKRSDVKKLLYFNIVRDKIPIFSIDASYMVNDSIGYVKINRFAANTHIEFKEALDELKEAGMKKLILDLKGNGGGYLKTAFRIADEFLDNGRMIVYTEGVNSPKKEMKASHYGTWKTNKIIVLVDQSSASASEIVSGALQDWDRGLVIGRRTFGKGLVQRPFPLPDGSQIRLTIADYYTPSGRFIQKSYAKGTEAYRKELNDRYKSGELTDSMKHAFPDSLKFKTSGGRTVYGGGGITPDVFVALDTTGVSDYFMRVVRTGVVNKFVLNYLNKNRKQLKKYYTTIEYFEANFEIDDTFLEDFVKYAKKNKIEEDKEGLKESQAVLATRLKSLFARDLFSEEAYYIISNKHLNPSFQKAVEIFENNQFNKLLNRDF